MNSIFKKPVYSPKPGRNGFDISRRRLYTCSVGQMLPVYWDIASPGDEYKINTSAFIRTEAVETAAFTRFKVHFDAHFVPMRQIYSFFNEFFNGVNDVQTNFVADQDSHYMLPEYDFSTFINSPQSNSNFLTEAGPDAFNFVVDEFNVPKVWNARRLFDLFGYGNVEKQQKTSGTIERNLLPYLAYHKIYYSHYNNADWFVKRQSLYNVDKYYDGSIPEIVGDEIISKIHYRPWRSDYFTNLYPSPIFGESFMSAMPESFPNITNISLVNLNRGSSNTDILHNDTNVTLFSDKTKDTAFTVDDLRSAFAVDKLLRITGAAGSHYAQQTFAHFGVKMPDDITNSSIFIGSNEVDLGISEVVAQSSTGVDAPGSVLGDIAGKGFGRSDGGDIFRYKCKEHGIIMIISSIEPIVDYSSQAIDVLTRYKNSVDFYHPEFDDLGMQPMENSTLDGDSRSSGIIGWQFRYSELKTKYDVVNEGFYDTDKVSWQTNFQQAATDAAKYTIDKNYRFCICPQYSNNIFALPFPTMPGDYVANYTGTNAWNSKDMKSKVIYAGDNFLVAADFNVFKTSTMSVHSLPKIF